jgi:hypothetical protein
MMTPYEEATRTVPLVDAALANSSTMVEWRDPPASTTTNSTGEHHQLGRTGGSRPRRRRAAAR